MNQYLIIIIIIIIIMHLWSALSHGSKGAIYKVKIKNIKNS